MRTQAISAVALKSLAIFSSSLAVSATFMVSGAEAQTAGCNGRIINGYGDVAGCHSATQGVIRTESQNVQDQVRTSITEQTAEVIQALRGQARENTNYQQMQIEANQRIADANAVNDTNRLKDEIRAEAESGAFDPNPFSCMLVDIFADGSGATPIRNGSAVGQQVNDWVAGDHPAVKAGGATLTKHVSDKQQEFAGFRNSPNATTDWRLLMEEPTLDLSDPRMAEVAKLIMQNSIDSTPPREVSDEERLTPSGLDRIAADQQRSGRMNAATDTVTFANNLRSNVISGESLDTYRTMAADSAYNRPIGDTMSELQQLDIMTVWNYAPRGERLEKLTGSMSEKAWLFEIHRALSIQTRIDFLALELATRNANVNALVLATLNDAN